jgi:predicted dehydrogenase
MANATPQKVKVGIVGCGVVATAYYLPCLMKMPTVDLVAVCDRRQTRTAACTRLFGAKEQYTDYDQMLAQSELDAIFILTAPGTHASFALKAIHAGKHILLQKPMATNMEDARQIAAAVRRTGVKAVIEPSSATPLDPDITTLRSLIKKGVLGEVQWFSLAPTGPTTYGPSLGNNPYGLDAFYTKDSGGFLFDFPYGPIEIVGLLGPCKSVMATARISSAENFIVPESKYDDFLATCTDPDHANYWEVVVDLPRTQRVQMEAYDNVYSLYEMKEGGIGVCHVGRIHHPVLPGSGGGGLQIFGTDGNLMQGSIISKRRDLLPKIDADGWFRLPLRGHGKAKWPQPLPGAFNYYHESTRHLIDCILQDRDPLVNIDWGLHITEMMAGAVESYTTGKRYEMTTTLEV